MASRWKKGESGNPAGRPPGRGDWRTKLRSLLEAEGPAIIAALVKQAKTGDVTAGKAILDKLIPSLRAEAVPVQISLPKGAGLSQLAEAILQAAARGEISAETAHDFAGIIAAASKVKEMDDLEKRVAALETKGGSR